MMKKIIIGMFVLATLQSCGDRKVSTMDQETCIAYGGTLTDGICVSNTAMTEEACAAAGGKLSDGNCLAQANVGPQAMKKYCASQGLEYSEKYAGCFASEVEQRRACEALGKKYSEKYKGCLQ